MDNTKFVVTGRDQALLYGDYSSYRVQLSRRILAIRRKLGRSSKKGVKYVNAAPITALDIGRNNEFCQLLLLTSERAWAHAMLMKSTHSTNTKGITGTTRSHIISRLHKAANIAEYLSQALEDRLASKATIADILEMRAYATSLTGAEKFEKHDWEACMRSYTIAWVIYTALSAASKNEAFKDLLSSTVEPSIRYSAYQVRIPRTVDILTIARKYFPGNDIGLASEINDLDPGILRESSKVTSEFGEPEATSSTIKWRSRTVEVEDASIAAALATVTTAIRSLEATLSLADGRNSKERAAAYDEILIASQDVVDATKHAMDDLVAEGISQSDRRMQSLQIIRTALSYEMISWRIGRNRVLTGDHDGARPDTGHISRSPRIKKARAEKVGKEEGAGRRLARLQEKVVLYDSTLQSIESIKELPGVAADPAFLHEIGAKHHYFRALKCLAIARSYSILFEHHNALALFARATDLLSIAIPTLISLPLKLTSATSPLTFSISHNAADSLSSLITAELHRHRALVELSKITTGNKITIAKNSPKTGPNMVSVSFGAPLIEDLSLYHTDGVDLSNLVTYPPKLEPIFVKPLFFDVAWNHIRYPNEKSSSWESKVGRVRLRTEEQVAQAPRQDQKKGWFGFGR